ncbi:hypothetical protein WMY93_002868 [Mugilogobius chulae]|uniref:Coiled-coil domain-containing protein 89 n=1 Tax=Mugilogobius chulae TaxID=88201 RepID=A0AAW0PYC2_9GOBI
MENKNLVEGKSVEELETLHLALENLWVFSGEDAADIEVLRSRIDEQSTLISILKQRSDELLLRCQALQKINSELDDKISDSHKELEEQRKKYETLEKRFMVLAANNQAIIVFKDEYKSQNEDLRQRNQQLQSENELLFSKKLQDKELTVQRLTEEISQLKEKDAQKEYDYRFKRESQMVNADARVKSLQSDLEESTLKYKKLKKDFDAFKEHSTNLLIQERELNKKLRHMTG